MNKMFTIVLISILFSCKSVEEKKLPSDDKNNSNTFETKRNNSDETIRIDANALTKDFMTWYNYTYYKIHLSEDFIGLDNDSLKIDKLTFLEKLQSGNHIPFKIGIFQGQAVYRLYNLSSIDENIKATIKQKASTEITHFKMEGTELPDFNFTDLNSNNYSKKSIKGKLMVLKCWFVHCTACVKEFPELNKLVNEYKSIPDVLFVSLAMDSKEDLQNFLKAKEFKYAVVPGMTKYMTEKLGIMEYPTHLLVNSNGIIIKVTNRIEELIPFLNTEKSKSRS